MTDNERTAMAMLRSGSNWKEAAEATRVTVERLQILWAAGRPGSLLDPAVILAP